MSPILPPATILVTGANGFVAVWVVKYLLERGFKVRGTVRDSSKGDFLRDLFKDYPSSFEYVIVKDITKDNAFDEVVQGVDGVAHTAAVFKYLDDPRAMIDPAVKGTLSILNAVKNKGANVKRVVLTSSAVAVLQPHPEVPSYIHTDVDWNYDAVEQTEKHPNDTPGYIKYYAAKVLAELEFWKFFKENDGLTFDGVTINPPWIFGPILHDVSSPEGLNTSLNDFSGFLKHLETADTTDVFTGYVGNLSDVRDVGVAHVEALLSDKASGKRLLIATKAFTFQDILDAINTADRPLPIKVPIGNPGASSKVAQPTIVDGSKAQEILGLKYTPWQTTVVDSVLTLKERGW